MLQEVQDSNRKGGWHFTLFLKLIRNKKNLLKYLKLFKMKIAHLPADPTSQNLELYVKHRALHYTKYHQSYHVLTVWIILHF